MQSSSSPGWPGYSSVPTGQAHPLPVKFLRRASTERRHIDALVTRYAMAYPHLRFTLQNDGRQSFRSPGSGSLYDVLIELYGLETAQEMIAVGE